MMPPAGTMIPEGVVPSSFCGTHGTGWMNGVHPTTLGEQVVRQICFYYSNDYCQRSRNTDVTNCGEYYVYKLQAAPTCDLGYCAEGGNFFCLNVGFKIHHSEALPNTFFFHRKNPM